VGALEVEEPDAAGVVLLELPLPLERHAARLNKHAPASTPDSSLRLIMTLLVR
jgi:hypothetical protein